MSYLRGEYYTYSDGQNIHLPSDTLPMEIWDILVVMRYAELTKKQKKKIEKLAYQAGSGNFGCDELAKKLGGETAMQWMKKCLEKKGVKK